MSEPLKIIFFKSSRKFKGNTLTHKQDLCRLQKRIIFKPTYYTFFNKNKLLKYEYPKNIA